MQTLQRPTEVNAKQNTRLSSAKIAELAGILRTPETFKMIHKRLSFEDPVDEALKVLVPAWPLQNTVAVNPFWNLRNQPFWAVLSQLEPLLHQQMLMPLDYFRKKYNSGEITNSDLSNALDQARQVWENLPDTVADLIKIKWGDLQFDRQIQTACEITPSVLDLNSLVVAEIGKFAAAYFDQNQALVAFPWKNLSFWKAWQKAMSYDHSLQIAGYAKTKSDLWTFENLNPRQAIEVVLAALNIKTNVGKYLYLQRASATVMGWGSQFCYEEWQKGLGYQTSRSAKPVELLAVRVVYDYLIFKHHLPEAEAKYQQWSDNLNMTDVGDSTQEELFALLYVWQLASELAYQRSVALKMSKSPKQEPEAAKAKLIFCIDVRSEMIRRHIEATNKRYETIGFAGFFATAIDYKPRNEATVGHRLPVLLKPAITLVEVAKSQHENPTTEPTNNTFVSSYFRNLRKAPLSSFLFVELFGILSVANILRRTLRYGYLQLTGQRSSKRFNTKFTRPNVEGAKLYSANRALAIDEKIAFVANALTHMGQTQGFAPLNLIVGHGAETVNNAFGSALDCGACGGHAGDVNARFLVGLLNNRDVREGLTKRNINIPMRSYFVAAVHETVTDEIHILDEDTVPDEQREALASLKVDLERASKQCRIERQTSRSHCLDTSAVKRSLNWSEVRPEWGLSGNACFIVAPRHRSLGVNLSSRSFLHDYNWKMDEGFKTLELIMTAPMVVTNWINMQYYASVTAPAYYGSGNKVLHNLTNETGVVEGNGGDLRIGLPIQSVHDGEKFVHDPLRLSVFIEAPRAEIEAIIAKHEVVRDLVNNEWLHILHIDSESNIIARRQREGSYLELMHQESIGSQPVLQ